MESKGRQRFLKTTAKNRKLTLSVKVLKKCLLTKIIIDDKKDA